MTKPHEAVQVVQDGPDARLVTAIFQATDGEILGRVEVDRTVGSIRLFTVDSEVIHVAEGSDVAILYRGQFLAFKLIQKALDVLHRIASTDDPMTAMVASDLVKQAYHEMRRGRA